MGDALATAVFTLVFLVMPVVGLVFVAGGPVGVVTGVVASRRRWPKERGDRWVRRGIYAFAAGIVLLIAWCVAVTALVESIGS